MRNLSLSLTMGSMFLIAGCADSKWGFLHNSPEQARITTEKPTAANLVAYVNRNAQQLRSIECMDVELDCKAGQQAIGMQAKMACQKDKNFRLVAYVVGNT